MRALLLDHLEVLGRVDAPLVKNVVLCVEQFGARWILALWVLQQAELRFRSGRGEGRCSGKGGRTTEKSKNSQTILVDPLSEIACDCLLASFWAIVGRLWKKEGRQVGWPTTGRTGPVEDDAPRPGFLRGLLLATDASLSRRLDPTGLRVLDLLTVNTIKHTPVSSMPHLSAAASASSSGTTTPQTRSSARLRSSVAPPAGITGSLRPASSTAVRQTASSQAKQEAALRERKEREAARASNAKGGSPSGRPSVAGGRTTTTRAPFGSSSRGAAAAAMSSAAAAAPSTTGSRLRSTASSTAATRAAPAPKPRTMVRLCI